MSHPTPRRWSLLALVVGLSVAAVFGQAGVSAAGEDDSGSSVSNLDNEETYEYLGYGTCSTVERPGKQFEPGAAPAGSHWSLLALQAGTPASTTDWNTVVENPSSGPHVHPSGQKISQVILCHSPGADQPSAQAYWNEQVKPSSSVGGRCDDYTPTMVTVDPTTVTAGEQVTISGYGVPGDTVTATLVPGQVPLGEAVVGPDGKFTITATIPAGTRPGNYKIVVASTQCPTSTKVTIQVVGAVSSGCGQSREGRTFEQESIVTWELHSPSFSTSDPVTLRLDGVALYSGPWPASDSVEIKIETTPSGKYWMVQEGTKSNGRGDMSKKCPVWIVHDSALVSATSAPGSSDSGPVPVRPLVASGALAVGLYALIRLGARRARLGRF